MPRPGLSPLTLLAVFAGGVLGTGLRLGADGLIPSESFPFATLAVNIVGSFLLAVLVGRFWTMAPGWLRAGLGVGLLGAFTTFSAVVVAMLEFARGGQTLLAGAYLAASLVLGLAAAVAGLGLAGPRATSGIDEVNE